MFEEEFAGIALLFFFVIIGGIIANKFRQPIFISLLIIGSLIGPHAFNFIHNQQILDSLMDIGTILLLFVVGMEFVVSRLAEIGFKAMMLGILKIGIIFFASFETLILIGIDSKIALVLGFMLTLSSTVVIVKILEAKGLYKRQEMHLLLGILIIEDIISVVILTFLNNYGKGNFFVLAENIFFGLTILCIVYFLFIKFSKFIIPWFLKHSGDHAITFIALGLCTFFSYLAFLLGISPATGAFLAGSIIASLPEAKLFEHAIKPYSDLFSCLFFVSVGTYVNFSSLKEHLSLIGILLIIVIITRFIAIGLIGYIFANFRNDQPVFSSIAMIAFSEFSLLIAKILTPMNLGIDLISISAALVLITAIIMSIMISYVDKINSAVDDMFPIEWRSRPETFSNYIKLIFDETAVENTHTKNFKRALFGFLANIIMILFFAILWRKIIVYISAHGIDARLSYISHVFFACLILFLLYRSYMNSSRIKPSLVEILTSGNSFTNMKQSTYIINNFFIIFLMFFIAIFSPAIITLLKLPVWVNILSGIILVITIIKLKKVTHFIHHKKLKSYHRFRDY